MDNKNTKPKMSKKKKILIIIAVVLIVFLLLGIGIFFGGKRWIENKFFNPINRVDLEQMEIIPPEEEDFEKDDYNAEYEEVDPKDIDWGELSDFNDEELINILLVGQDRRKGQGRQRSDTMILCSVNPETKEISLISFLRDLYVQFPGGYSNNRLNAAYAFGGFPLLDETIENNFGITIDYNLEVDFNGFIEVFDYIGGVDVELTQAEADYLTKWWGKKEVPDWGPFTAGVNHLDGEEALAYARIRKIDSDFGRTTRQRTVLKKGFDKIKHSSVNDLLKMTETLLPYITTDMTNDDIWDLLFEIAPIISSVKLNSYSVPDTGDYSYANVNGMSVILPNMNLIREKLQKTYLPY
ncbi:MAG: LytR family transcriptional regulator [Ruminococcaceae bacterium]|nr:LytR family transcriptional regulator [Oscillospiraceae bacterium]